MGAEVSAILVRAADSTVLLEKKSDAWGVVSGDCNQKKGSLKSLLKQLSTHTLAMAVNLWFLGG